MSSPAPPVPGRAQLLGVAFASADVAFEATDDGVITFALGAMSGVFGVEAARLCGLRWRELFAAEDLEMLRIVLADLKPGERRGPLKVGCVSADRGIPTAIGDLSVFRLPENCGAVSFAFRRGWSGDLGARRDGFIDRSAFDAMLGRVLEEAASSGAALNLDLVDLTGFAEAQSAASYEAGELMRRELAANLRAASYGGLPAAEVAVDRFAMVRSAGVEAPTDKLAEIAGVPAQSHAAPLDPQAGAQTLRAVRYALDRHIESGPQAGVEGFGRAVRETMAQVRTLESALMMDAVPLHYQPIVDLKTGEVHHFEALARIGDDAPQELFSLAEQLGFIARLDLAIFRNVADTLQVVDGVDIAVNISASSLMCDGFVAALLAETQGRPGLPSRLLIEITETFALKEPERANRLIGRLRRAGHLVCLDDFGAGAASFDHLRRLDVDIVKIDGRYIRGVGPHSRDFTVLRHIVAMCRDLGAKVVAEMVEDEASAAAARELGVDLGQGFLYGGPQPTLFAHRGRAEARRRRA